MGGANLFRNVQCSMGSHLSFRQAAYRPCQWSAALSGTLFHGRAAARYATSSGAIGIVALTCVWKSGLDPAPTTCALNVEAPASCPHVDCLALSPGSGLAFVNNQANAFQVAGEGTLHPSSCVRFRKGRFPAIRCYLDAASRLCREERSRLSAPLPCGSRARERLWDVLLENAVEHRRNSGQRHPRHSDGQR